MTAKIKPLEYTLYYLYKLSMSDEKQSIFCVVIGTVLMGEKHLKEATVSRKAFIFPLPLSYFTRKDRGPAPLRPKMENLYLSAYTCISLYSIYRNVGIYRQNNSELNV